MVIAEVDIMDSSYTKKVGGNSGPSPVTRPRLGPRIGVFSSTKSPST